MARCSPMYQSLRGEAPFGEGCGRAIGEIGVSGATATVTRRKAWRDCRTAGSACSDAPGRVDAPGGVHSQGLAWPLCTGCANHDFTHARVHRCGVPGSVGPCRNRTSAPPGKGMAQFLNGDIGVRPGLPEDQFLMCLNVSRAAVPAQRTRIAGRPATAIGGAIGRQSVGDGWRGAVDDRTIDRLSPGPVSSGAALTNRYSNCGDSMTFPVNREPSERIA